MRLTLFLLASVISLSCYGQFQNANWCFGQNVGLSFIGNNSGSAPNVNFGPGHFVPVINASEGVATVSHRFTRNLLFYSNKGDLYDKNYNPMPNGIGISADKNGTSAQGVCIVPVVNDIRNYYVFTLGGVNGLLAYSIVNTTLNGGLGDVIVGQKNIPIDSGFSEAMTVVEGCKGYWLIVYKQLTSSFYAYRITTSGISTTPVVSTTVYPKTTGDTVTIKVSPDRSLLGLTSWAGSFVAMHDFDPILGSVTNARLIDTNMNSASGFYGCDFSPNSKRFYISAHNKKDIYQYDLAQATTAAVIASRKTVHHDTLFTGAIQLGPDGSMYIAMEHANWLGRIRNANTLFPGCKYISTTIFGTSSSALFGLPQRVVRPIQQGGDSAFVSMSQKTDCLNPPTVLYAPKGMISYKWQNGSTADSFIVNTPGTFWVTATDGCATFADSFFIVGYTSYESHTTQDSICPGDSLILFHYRDMIDDPSRVWSWNTGSTNDSITVSTPGQYIVIMRNNFCHTAIDTFNIVYRDTSYKIRVVDDSICAGQSLTLFSQVDSSHSGSTRIWNTGSTNDSINILTPGKYWVTTKNNTCHEVIDTFNIGIKTLAFTPTPDTIICPDDTMSLSAGIFPNGTHVVWGHGDTGLVIKVYDKGTYTFVAEFEGCEVDDRINLTQYPNTMIELGEDREVCSDELIMLPTIVTSEEEDKYKWQNGSTGRVFRVTESGTYHVEVLGHCQTLRDTVNITVHLCHLFFPSIFSPNGDGKNDNAHLVGDIANVSQYELHIFNRWGNEVFASNDVNIGWDGTYKGKPAAMTTYYYYIKFRYNNKDEMMKGDLTLIR